MSLTTIFTVLIGLCAYLCYKHPDIVLVLLPQYADAEFLRLRYPNRNIKNEGVAREPMISVILPSENIDASNIAKVFDPSGYPVLVKNVLNTNQDQILQILSEKNKGKNLRMLDLTKTADVPHFSPSCSPPKTVIDIPFDEYAENHLFSNVAKNHSYNYAGFEAITDVSVLKELTGIDMTTLGPEYRQNNLFSSNFPRELLSASMHCAPIDSLTFQLIGTKTWYFVSPEDLARIKNIPMPTAFPLPMSDDELLSSIKNIHIVKQEAGDVVYFGPHWCHAVSTKEGPNIMFNMRYNAMEKLKAGPFSLLFKILVRLYTRQMGGLPQDNIKIYYPIYDELNQYFTDCGPSKYFNKLWKRVQEM